MNLPPERQQKYARVIRVLSFIRCDHTSLMRLLHAQCAGLEFPRLETLEVMTPFSPASERITLLGRTFIRESSLAKRRSRSGWFWKHGRALIECSSGVPYFHCLECKRKTWLLKPYSTDHIHTHLRKEHNLGPEGKLMIKGPIDRALQSASSSSSSETAATLIAKL